MENGKLQKDVKHIEISNGKHLKPIVSMIQEYEIVKHVLLNIFERFMNEHNANEYQECLESLQEYRYIKSDYSVPDGRFIRYIDVSKPQKMKIKSGGFVIEDMGYGIKIKSVVEYENAPPNIFNIRKDKHMVFMKIDGNEKLRFACESTLGDA